MSFDEFCKFVSTGEIHIKIRLFSDNQERECTCNKVEIVKKPFKTSKYVMFNNVCASISIFEPQMCNIAIDEDSVQTINFVENSVLILTSSGMYKFSKG